MTEDEKDILDEIMPPEAAEVFRHRKDALLDKVDKAIERVQKRLEDDENEPKKK